MAISIVEVLGPNQVEFRVCNPWVFLVDPERDCPAAGALIPYAQQLTTQQLLEFYPPPVDAMERDSMDGESAVVSRCGNEAMFEVPVLAEATVNGTTLLTVKRIPVYLDETDKQNPDLEKVDIVSEEDGVHTLSISVDPSSLDTQCRNEIGGLEALRVYVYSTSGSFEESFVDIVPDSSGEVRPVEMQWTSSGEPALLVLVAADNEGGVDWQTLTL